MSKIIVTGSMGLIGSKIVKYLKKKHDVLGADLSCGSDFTDENYNKEFFSKFKADYLVNCFAINNHVNWKKFSNLFDISLDSFREFMETNVTALFSVCREFARQKTSKGIVNFSSTYGVVSPRNDLYKGEKHIGYSVSKSADIMLSKHLAIHLAPRVRVNCLVPGGIENKQDMDFISKYSMQTPMKRMMRGNELNGIVGYLCSEESSYMTGSIITIDGGWTAW